MGEITENEWEAIQGDINTYKTCLSENLFQQVIQPPARPWNPIHRGRLLFLSEYLPSQGGFWKTKVENKLRTYLFDLLGRHGYLFPTDAHSPEALKTFLSHRFFLIQTIKWPLRQGLSFNSLGPDEQQQLITHVAEVHLRREIELCAPRLIVALGDAAWQACARLSAQSPLPSPGRGVNKLHGKNHQMVLSNMSIPLNITFLPVHNNMKERQRAQAVQDDLVRFLVRAAMVNTLVGKRC